MCGIAGWYKIGPTAEAREAILERMCGTLRHRGPDDSGLYVDGHVGLGMRRLAIVDVEHGHQPMASDDGAVRLVFNGEIYNHAELRAELIKAGVRFRTTSDTEVLLRLYEQAGLAAFDRMNGMFGVAIWDARQRVFHLVRDRLGVKPLYYARVGDGLVFGSEIKAILAGGLITKAINENALWNYLTFRYVPGPDTIWQDVYKLPPAHRLSFPMDAAQPTVTRWWDMAMCAPKVPHTDAQYEEEFCALFEDAVRLRMMADVPVGITLSGGLDSSAVVAAASHYPDSHLQTFSVAFSGSTQTDELPHARTVAKHYGTDHHEVVFGQREFMDFLPRLVWHTDEPLADLASVPLYYVCELASRDVKVVLSGEGSDEIFAGYDFDRLALVWDKAIAARENAPWLKGFMGALGGRVSSALARKRAEVTAVIDQRATPVPYAMTNYWSNVDKEALWPRAQTKSDSLDVIRRHLQRAGETHPLNQVLYTYCQDWLVEDLLMKADRMSMAASVELRTPFLDYRLVEWAATLPTRLKAGPSPAGVYRTKEILRRYASTRMPQSIIDRPKQGFPVPVYDWLSGSLAAWARDTLSSTARVAAYFDRDALARVVESGTAERASTLDRHRLWNLLILETWMCAWTA